MIQPTWLASRVVRPQNRRHEPASSSSVDPINVVLYYAGWLACVVGAANGQWIASALLGATGGPAAFYAGLRLGAVSFHPTPGLSLVVLAAVWSALFPFLMRLTHAIAGPGPGYYRFVGK